MPLVHYETGTPEQVGVYACRVPLNDHEELPLLDDVFLMWYENKWWYLGSDQWYRGDVLGFVGPLARQIRR